MNHILFFILSHSSIESESSETHYGDQISHSYSHDPICGDYPITIFSIEAGICFTFCVVIEKWVDHG